MAQQDIRLKKVSVHNLRGVSLSLPAHQLIVFTGVSGSGKSSLAFDTIFVEGQRRYIESLSTHARRFLGSLPKPQAESIEGLPPTVAIEQKSAGKNPRSTVGTMTGIYDFLRVLYARLAVAYCPISHERVMPISREEIATMILAYPEGSSIILLAPFAKGKRGEFKEDFQGLLRKGFLRVRIDGTIYHLEDDEIALDKEVAHDVDLVIDKVTIGPSQRTRLHEAIASALEIGKGLVSVVHTESKEERLFSEHAYSAKSGISYPPLEPEEFSFNHPKGMCSTCEGLGVTHDFDLNLVIDPDLSISEDCCSIAGSYKTVKWGNIYDNLAKYYQFKVTTPWKDLPEKAKEIFLHGADVKWIKMSFVSSSGSRWTDYVHWSGVLHEAKKRLTEATSDLYRNKVQSLMRKMVCPKCEGARIAAYPAAAEFRDKKITELTDMMIIDLSTFFKELTLSPHEQIIGEELIHEIKERLAFLHQVGLDYLTLSRTAPTLSGGESQRVRLASQIGSGLVGAAYVLDEPSIGLHPSDNTKLLTALHTLKQKGNTVIVVEHDEETIRSADYIVDIGPKAGVEGGEIIAMGSLEDLLAAPRSLTGAYLKGTLSIPIPKKRRKGSGEKITVVGATHHNLKKIDLTLPLGCFIAVTGISGSGKSSLILDILYPALANHHHKAELEIGAHKEIRGMDLVDKVIAIDQSPIGRTPRSNPATYTKLLDDIRELFAELPESKAFGYKAGRFSFNVREGSCPHCKGMGMLKIDMDFMEDEWIPCQHCKGERFDSKTLSVRYRGKNIYEVLEMSIAEAESFFKDLTHIHHKLDLLLQVGLGYIKLGQSATTLSGGEAQRIKLAKELIRPSTGKTLYILDEPTTGLHFYDIHKLIDILQKLVDLGNTVLVIEHNMDLVKTVDWVIDMGPHGGAGGGLIVAQGKPEALIKCDSPTAPFLKEALTPDKGPLTKITLTPHIPPLEAISIEGARQNNLKNLSLSIPRGKVSVFTGPSGSGKSSLAFETIYAEGQRRYIDSLSPYARQFVKMMAKPKVERIEGLSPAIAIEQRKHMGNPRSTLGTMTEVYDFLRILYSRLGTPHCPETGEVIRAITIDYVIKKIMELPQGSKIHLLAPIELKHSDDFTQWKARMGAQGFLRIRLGGKYYELDEEIPYNRHLKQDLAIVVDRLILKEGIEKRLHEDIEQAALLSQNRILIALEEKDLFFNLAFAVESTGKSYPLITHHTFSFNAEEGMCPECQGLGLKWGAHLDSDPSIIRFTPVDLFIRLCKEELSQDALDYIANQLDDMGIDAYSPLKKCRKDQIQLFFEGSDKHHWVGINKMLTRLGQVGKNPLHEEILPLLEESKCPSCHGTRLNELARNVRIEDASITDLASWPLSKLLPFLEKLTGPTVLTDLLTTLRHRLTFLSDIGLHYLSIDRSASTLSGGEVQRAHLARQLGSGLTGVLYVLDEPTASLHPHDNTLLLGALEKLVTLKNTLLLVEHDLHTLSMADYIYDFGPGSGNHGGEIVASGTPQELKCNPHSLTGAYLSGAKTIPIPNKRRVAKEHFSITGATLHNLSKVDIEIPIGSFTCITGVSGSGKSTLIYDILMPALSRNVLLRKPKESVEYQGALLNNVGAFTQLLSIDQSPIGQTIRSDISTYTDLLTPLRYFFASLPEASSKGLMPRHFSANDKVGMCKKCRGLGFQPIQLQFLPPAHLPCDSCHGYKLGPISLSINYKGKHLGQLLKLTVSQAKDLLPPIPKVVKILDTLDKVGLDYLTLGQETATLSGGEGGRLRLSRELAKRSSGHTLYLFDEPTTGLHSDDIARLLPIFHSLVKKGHTLLIIEHNLDVIASADHIIDLGPDAGAFGGRIVATGTPEEIAKSATHTGRALNAHLSSFSCTSSQ